MYKIRRPAAEDCSTLPVATVPSVLRHYFQFFTGNEKLHYFNYVERRGQNGKIMPRVAIVVQTNLVIADLKGRVKRCIAIQDISTIKVEVVQNTSMVHITVPSEYDILVDVIRSGQVFIKALTLIKRMMGESINLIMGTLGAVQQMNLKCPSGLKKKTCFQLLETTQNNIQSNRSGSSSSDRSQRSTSACSLPICCSKVCLDLGTSLTSEMSFPTSDSTWVDLNSTLPTALSSIASSQQAAVGAAVVILSACELLQELTNVLSAISRESRCGIKLESKILTNRTTTPTDDIYSGDLRSGSCDTFGKTKWVVGDTAEVFHSQDSDFMGWSSCSVVNFSDSGVTIRLHITSLNTSPDLIDRISVKGTQLRRPIHTEPCLVSCWCS